MILKTKPDSRAGFKFLSKCNTFKPEMCKKKLLTPWFILVVFFLKAQVSWPPVYQITSDTAVRYDLDSAYWQILEDKPGTLDINQVSGPLLADSFYHFRDRKMEEGIHTCWFRFRIKNGLDKRIGISLSSQASRADFYIFRDSTPGAGMIHLVTGNLYSWKNKDGFKRVSAVPLSLDSMETLRVYFRWHKINSVFSDLPDSLTLRGYHTEKLRQSELEHYESGYVREDIFIPAFLAGFFILAAILNLLIFLAAKEKLYLYFSLFLLSISFWYNPLFTDILYREYPLTSDFINRLGLSWLFFVLHFIRHYFRSFERFPKWDRFMVYLSVIYLINLVVPPVPVDFFYRPEVIIFKGLFLILYILLLGVTIVKCLLVKGPARRPFITAALPFILYFLAALIIYALFDQQLKAYGQADALFNYGLGLGIAWLVVMFSWYLYRRYASQQNEITEALLAKEKLEHEKEAERLALIAKQNLELEQKVKERTADLAQSLENLKATQDQLIHSEKMASLGELTAGIAHEIQNPLNFVNNFSEVNKELIEELRGERLKAKGERSTALEEELLKSIEENELKIIHHGKRADAIVKGMLQHSRSDAGQKELTDINPLCEEFLRLSYHGLRAKDKGFNAFLETDFDPSAGKINIVAQDLGRVLLNLYNNAFYAVSEKRNTNLENFEPKVVVRTRRGADRLFIHIADNGNGIPPQMVDKIFQPFFTTKPTGQGTGLGLSITYDIIKAHGGSIEVKSEEGRGTEFIIQLPV
ncbi:MAG TPA: ATP-binding protein [Saprospiraceae bacterium]|nr:ATP-binding protein [Saprospiraceae bacterium]